MPMRPNSPKTTAATAPTTASVSSAFTVGSTLQPANRTTVVSPMHSATAAANRIRRTGGATPSAPHRAGDHEALDLVRALVDLRDLRVAHHALDGVLVDVAVAAEHLDRLDGHRHRGVRGEQLRHRRPLAEAALGTVRHRARLVQKLARGRRSRLHVGELELDALQVVDRRAERDALLRV